MDPSTVFFRADLGGQLVLSQGKPGKKGEGIAGKAEDEGQEKIRPVDTGSLQPEEGGKRAADGDAPEQPRHDLAEFYLAASQNRVAKEEHSSQQKEDRDPLR